MVTESWSSKRAMSTLKVPADIHCQSTTSWLRSSAGRPSRVTKAATATAKLRNTIAGARMLTARFPSRVPNSEIMSVPSAGNNSINQA